MITLPPIGFGTGQIPDGSLCVESIHHALSAGYRLIDTAAIYGNEASVGQAIAQSPVAREDIIVTSKLHISEKGAAAAQRACRDSLARLQLDYIDLYLIHWPANAVENPNDWSQLNTSSWSGLEQLYEEGLVRAIGVSNFMPEHLEPLLEQARYLPVVNQVEFHPGHMQTACRQYCAEQGILLEAWSPLGMGELDLLSYPLLLQLAERYQKSTAQICLRWCLQHGSIPLPKSTTPHRIRENYHIFDFELTDQEMLQIDGLPSTAYSGWSPYCMKVPN